MMEIDSRKGMVKVRLSFMNEERVVVLGVELVDKSKVKFRRFGLKETKEGIISYRVWEWANLCAFIKLTVNDG